MKCPKCSTEASETARFCPRCHATLRFECPACHHEQRHGGHCDKCGVDFMKFFSAVMLAKQAESQASHERTLQRSSLLKTLLIAPFGMGIPLIRSLLNHGRRHSRN